MQPEINEAEGHLAPLKKVTPVSKYLAMTLFIILPFLGGWIGYTYAPEKVVEVERVVQIEKKEEVRQAQQSEQAIESSVPLLQYQPIIIEGEILGGELNNPGIFSFDDESFYVDGEAVYSITDGTFEQFLTDNGLFKGWIRLDDELFALTPVELGTWQLSTMPDELELDSFEIIGSDYVKDTNNVYYQAGVLEGSTVDDFELITNEFLDRYPVFVSNSNVYYRGELLEDINSKTFSVDVITDGTTQSFYIQDGDVIYFNRPVCNFETLERGELAEIESYNPVCSKMRNDT